ncbi:hypothetical protein Poly30_15870 [Planctomycetes bacterium Poly30]|uniref:Polymerase/histidinol phosphatase N-terminal domain-containing protein n=1 Tax=Saltatorellus ferox TaxID=2528018 RepID=A0A518EPR6_9BACT|nr:hypothetical protein Poly30_15870 [Planctomycetes bacterium Poly30]
MDEGRKGRGSRFYALMTLWACLAACDGKDTRPGAASDDVAGRSSAAPDLAPLTARRDQVRDFEADLAAKRHPGDGGGSARVTAAPERVVAGGAGRWTIEYTVGERGIEPGGVITLMPEPFWGWSTPQAERREFPGYTEVTSKAQGDATFRTATYGGAEAGMFLVTVEGAALEPGDTVTLDYGAGPAGARADRYAGRGARLWLAVDSDGDGVRALVESSPSVDVEAREPARAVLLGPSIVRPGETARYSVSLLDEWANAAPKLDSGEPWITGAAISGYPVDWSGPESVEIGASGSADFEVRVGEARPGSVRLTATVALPDETAVEAEANPSWVDASAPLIFWADLHGHSGLSDGTGAVEDYFRYARDVARLDVIALTDHDHFGVAFLDARPEWWKRIESLNGEFHEPGRFVSILGYEWTSWIHGHRHVLYFDGSGEVLSSISREGQPSHDTPTKLWDALRGQQALTIAHHSSGNPIPVNWTFPPDPELEPVTEVVSVHGSSEARDAPHVVAGSRPGQFVRDQLERGYRLGFIGSGDSHDGHPGLPHLSPGYGWRPANTQRGELVGTGGLAAIRASELSGGAVYEALRARRTYATSGPRIAVRERAASGGTRIEAAGTAPFVKADLVLGPPGAGLRSLPLEQLSAASSARDVAVLIPENEAKAHAYVYLRFVQGDGGTAWYGPLWSATSF